MANKASRKLELILEKKLRRSREIYRETTFLNSLAKDTAKQIKTRTQLGKSAEENGSSKKLKVLKESYKDIRRKNRNRLSRNTTVSRSNLTATGQMLNALFGIFRGKSIIIDIKEGRGKDLTGRNTGVTNKDLIDFNEDKGRRFFDLTKFEENELRRKIADKIRKLLAK